MPSPYAYAATVFAKLANLKVHENLFQLMLIFYSFFFNFSWGKLEACKHYSVLF